MLLLNLEKLLELFVAQVHLQATRVNSAASVREHLARHVAAELRVRISFANFSAKVLHRVAYVTLNRLKLAGRDLRLDALACRV